MTIASKLKIFSFLILLISLAFGYSFLSTSTNLKEQRNVNNIIQSIIKNTFEFSIITNEFISNRSHRVQSQWGNSHASLEKLFEKASTTLNYNDDKVALKKIMNNEVSIKPAA